MFIEDRSKAEIYSWRERVWASSLMRRSAVKRQLNHLYRKMWYIYTMEYYSAIKRNEIVLFAEMAMDLEIVIQSEVSQKEKNKYRIISLICGI